ncbi:winged helix-turn-helix transcriptional regulator [Thermosporothrix hazakensis]|jgi:hypothetical protein|uniref:winged helix-turn-helix transcriptional regulator n=1 Tax=Thermosporothrix hazakensis TaxID=644383 RepID=UPI000DAB764A
MSKLDSKRTDTASSSQNQDTLTGLQFPIKKFLPHVEYSVTDFGFSLKPIILLMPNWGEQHMQHFGDISNPASTRCFDNRKDNINVLRAHRADNHNKQYGPATGATPVPDV